MQGNEFKSFLEFYAALLTSAWLKLKLKKS